MENYLYAKVKGFFYDFLKNIWWNQKLYLHLLPKNHNSITKRIN